MTLSPEEIEKDEAVIRCKCHTLMQPIHGGLRCTTCGHQVAMREPEWSQMIERVKEQAAEIARLRAALAEVSRLTERSRMFYGEQDLWNTARAFHDVEMLADAALRGREE